MDKEKQLQKLREEWKSTADPVKRRIIEARAKMLKMSNNYNQVQDALGIFGGKEI